MSDNDPRLTDLEAAALDEADRLREQVKQLQAKLDKPCGSCHPCTNYADETWRAAGRKPPHVYQWDLARKALQDIASMVRQFDTPRDAGRVRAFVGDVGQVAARGLDRD